MNHTCRACGSIHTDWRKAQRWPDVLLEQIECPCGNTLTREIDVDALIAQFEREWREAVHEQTQGVDRKR